MTCKLCENSTSTSCINCMDGLQPSNKIYEALMVERETRQKFKEMKPKNKTNTQFLELLLSNKDIRK